MSDCVECLCQTLVEAVPPLLLAKSLGVEDEAVVPADADGSTVDPLKCMFGQSLVSLVLSIGF